MRIDVTDFLRARIGEDEDAALGATTRNGLTWATIDLLDGLGLEGLTRRSNPRADGSSDLSLWDDEGALGMWPETAIHIARWHPTRVVAECVAKARIVNLHQRVEAIGDTIEGADEWCSVCDTDGDWINQWPCPTLKAVLVPYSSHPDFDPAWSTWPRDRGVR